VNRAPIAWTLVAGLVSAAAINYLRSPTQLHMAGSAVITMAVIVINASQQRLTAAQIVVRSIGTLVALLVAFVLMPLAFLFGPLLVPSIVAFVIFLRRQDPWGCVATAIVGASGLILRFMLSVGEFSYPAFVLLVTAVAAGAVVALIHVPDVIASPSSSPSPE